MPFPFNKSKKDSKDKSDKKDKKTEGYNPKEKLKTGPTKNFMKKFKELE